MVGDNVDRSYRTFEIMSPNTKSFEDGEEFFVVGIVVQFGGSERAGVEGDRMDFGVRYNDRKDSCNCVIRSVCFENERSTGNEVCEDRSGDESLFERIEGFKTFFVEVPFDGFSGEADKRKDYVGVMTDESPIKVGKPQERLDVLHFAGFRPVLDNLDFSRIHSQTVRRKKESKILNSILVKSTFVGSSVEPMFSESSENFLNMFAVIIGVVGVDEDVVQVDDHCDVKKIGEDVVHEMLKCRRGISKSERHYTPFERAVFGSESGLPFISGGDADEVVSVTEVDFGIDAGFRRGT